MGEKAAIGVFQAVAQADPGAPAQGRKARDIHQLARRAVGLDGIGFDPPGKACHLGNHMRQIKDRKINAAVDTQAIWDRFVAFNKARGNTAVPAGFLLGFMRR